MTAGTAAQAGQADGRMNADRTALTDAMWARTGPALPGKATDPGVTAADNRRFPGAALRRFRTGSPRRGLPECSCSWNSVFKRFRRRGLSGVPGRVCTAEPEDPGLECVFADGAA